MSQWQSFCGIGMHNISSAHTYIYIWLYMEVCLVNQSINLSISLFGYLPGQIHWSTPPGQRRPGNLGHWVGFLFSGPLVAGLFHGSYGKSYGKFGKSMKILWKIHENPMEKLEDWGNYHFLEKRHPPDVQIGFNMFAPTRTLLHTCNHHHHHHHHHHHNRIIASSQHDHRRIKICHPLWTICWLG